MSTVTWHLLDICSGTGDDDVRVYAVELDVDDTLVEPRRTSLVAERDRGWARAHLCLDYLLDVGSRDDRMPLDGLGLSLFQGHLHTSSPSDTLDVQPVCVWVDERARRRYEPTVGNAHAPLLFEALGALPFVASPQELVVLACAARQCMHPPRRARGLPGAPVQVPALPRRAQRRLVAAALAQGVLAVLLLFGGSPPAAPQPTSSGPIPYIAASAGHVLVGPAQPSGSPTQMEPMRFAVLGVEVSEEPE
jgi:hypothetical protein